MATDLRTHGFVDNLFLSLNIRRELIGILHALLLTAFAMTSTLSGCAQIDVVAERKTAPIREGGIEDEGVEDEGVEDEGVEDAGKDGGDVCKGHGPRIRVGDSVVGEDACATGDPSLAFRYALCLCEDYPGSADLTTRSFDSSRIGLDSPSIGGSVGVNGYIQNDGLLNIKGSLRVAGDTEGRSITSSSENSEIRVGQDLEVQSAIFGDPATVRVGGDARVGGNIRLDAFTVGRSLTMPSDAILSVSELSLTNPVNQEPIQVEKPCACEETEDISALVAQASEDNDNELLDFEIGELEDFTGSIKLDLPCGQYYLKRLNVTGALTLSITGRAALYITEHVELNVPFTVDLAPKAEFELYLAVPMLATGDLTFGNPDNSERVRLFVGGTGTVHLEGKNLISGQVYAPRSELLVKGETEIYGSVFVRRAQLEAPLTIHYDRNPIETGLDCRD